MTTRPLKTTAGGASGTVTSVTLTMPAIFSVAGSPITSAGTFVVTLATQTANFIWSGPSSGGAAAPTFRALVSADIPNLSATKITSGTMATARLGSGTANVGTVLRGNSTWGAPPPDSSVTDVSASPSGAIANSTTEADFSTFGPFITANTLVLGDVIRIKAYFIYSTDVIPPTFRGRFKIDEGGGGAVTVLDTGAITTVGSLTNRGAWVEIVGVVNNIGASGEIEWQGYMEFATAATTGLSVNLTNTAGTVTDTTQDLGLTLTAQWGTADTDNSVTMRSFVMEILK